MPKRIVDPVATPGAAPETGGVMSDFGKETAKAFKSGYEHLHPKVAPPSGPIDALTGAVARVGAPLEMALSPVTGALHAFGGRGLAALESYAGEGALAGLRGLGVQTKPVTPDRQQMYEQAKADIDKAMLAAGPVRAGSCYPAFHWAAWDRPLKAISQQRKRRKPAAAATAAAKAVTKAAKTPAQQAQQELQQAGTPVDIPRALTIENPALRAGSVALSKAPVIGTPLDEAVRAVPAQMGAGLETMAGQFSPAMPENIVGGGIERSLTGAAEQEATARRAAAATADEAAQQTFEQTQAAREQAVMDRQAQV